MLQIYTSWYDSKKPFIISVICQLLFLINVKNWPLCSPPDDFLSTFQTQYRHESLSIVSTESQLVYSEFMQSLLLVAFNFKLENVLQVWMNSKYFVLTCFCLFLLSAHSAYSAPSRNYWEYCYHLLIVSHGRVVNANLVQTVAGRKHMSKHKKCILLGVTPVHPDPAEKPTLSASSINAIFWNVSAVIFKCPQSWATIIRFNSNASP